MIYDAIKAKLLSYATPVPGQPSFEVDWNSKDSKHIVMSSKDNCAYFLEVADPNTCKQL